MKLFSSIFLAGWICLNITGCGGGGNVGSQTDLAPLASGTAIGLGQETIGRGFLVRAGSEVLLTGKDSFGVDDPILDYQWQQIDNSGVSVTLFERIGQTVAFTAPSVNTETALEFLLTITDGDGQTASDNVLVTVIPIKDVNSFLLNPSVDENLYLFVSPAFGETLTSDMAFTLTLTPNIFWQDRDGNEQTVALETSVFEGRLTEGFTGTSNPVDSSNLFFQIPIPLLDIDEVNLQFQDENRSGRLEFELVSDAEMELEIEFIPTTGGSCSVYLARLNENGDFTQVNAVEVLGQFENQNLLPSDGALLNVVSGDLTIGINEEKVRQQLNIESKLSAENYYQCIDPLNTATTLDSWLEHAGFIDTSGNSINSNQVAHALYINNFDLGFGRDMFLRQDENGNVYSYVVNYPSLELAIENRGEFATVVMEYSPAPTGQCGDGTFSDTEKIVKFYSYVPDTTTGEMVRAGTMNFDGRGERALPGVCLACHNGSINSNLFNTTDLSSIEASNANLNASFMPWDLDAFLFTQAGNQSLIDPSFNPNNFLTETISRFSLEAQEDAFRQLNEGVLATFVDDVKRFEEPIRLIHGWYGNENALPAALDNEDARNDIDVESPLVILTKEELTQLPNNPFDGDYIQPGWRQHPDLYQDVFARNCRLCHVQQIELAINFETYQEFIDSALLTPFVYEQGVMPLSRLTMDRFWLAFDGTSESAAELLRTHLASLGNIVETSPGQPVAEFSLSNVMADIGDLITVDASSSLFADSLDWSLSSDCNSSALLSSSRGLSSAFTVDQSPCIYTVTLMASNAIGVDQISQQVQVDRTPSAVDFTASLDDYIPGDTSLLIDVVSNITNDGDGSLLFTVNVADEPYNLGINDNVTNNNDGTFTLEILALAGTNEVIEYQVEDINGTLSEQTGQITVVIDPIVPDIQSPMSISATSATIEWTVPTGFVADFYRVWRDGPIFDGFSEITTTTALSFVDNTLSSDSNYQYQVSAILGSEESTASDTVSVSTLSGVPTALASGSITTSSIEITWSDGPGGTADDYNLYRDSVLIASNIASPPYTDNILDANTAYSYQVSANFGATESSLSSALSVSTNPLPPTLDNIVFATDVTRTSVDLFWSPPSGGAPASYNVYVDGAFELNTTSTDTTISGLAAGTEYDFTVRTVGDNGESTDSNVETTTTLLTYTDDISGLNFITSQGCTGCHSLPSQLTNAVDTSNCLTDDNDLGDCPGNAGNMTGLTITNNERNLLDLWRTQGEN